MKQIKAKKVRFLARFTASDINEIDFEFLKNHGVKACFFDLDHTILRYGTYKLDKALASKLSKLKMDVFIATNRRESPLILKIAKQMGAKGIMCSTKSVFKPKKAYYRQLIKLAKQPPQKIAMVGDRTFQDIWGANRVDINSVLVSKMGPVKWWDWPLTVPDLVLPFVFKSRYKDVR